MKKKKTLVIIVIFCIVAGIWYGNFLRGNSNRVIHAFDNTYMTNEYYAPNLKYNDLSREVRKVVPEEEFDAWETWDDVWNSFKDVEKPSKPYDFIYHGHYVMLTYYKFSLAGYKLRYVEIEEISG